MSTRFMILIAAFVLATPLAARDAPDPAADAWCPRGDRDLPRGPEWHCYGQLDDEVSFAFVYPRSVEREPLLDSLIRTEAAIARDLVAAQVATAPAAPRQRYEAAWRVDAMLPEIAAASATIRHDGGIEYRTILIDRREGRAIAFSDLFGLGDFETTLVGYRIWGMRSVQAGMCAALTAEARKRRGDPTAAIECPDVERVPITLICGANGRIDTMRALLSPSVAGFWAVDPYEVDFPVDAAMMAAMKRRFRPAFGLREESRARIPARPCT